MKKFTILQSLFSLILCLSTFTFYAQEQIAVVQETKVMLLDSDTGEILNHNFIALGDGQAKGITQVNDQIWVTYQLGDRIERFNLDGELIGSINTDLRNIRGLAVVDNNYVGVTNWMAGNGAYPNTIVTFNFDGINPGFFTLAPSDSPMDIIDNGSGEVYISYHQTSNIERRDYFGGFLGNIIEPGIYSNIQQMEIEESGNLLAAVFDDTPDNPRGLYRFSIENGSALNYWPVGSAIGVAKLGNGDILFTTFLGGVLKLNPETGETTTIDAGVSQYFGRINPTLGTTDFNNNSFSFYPNPTNGLVTFNNSEVIYEISVTNLLGQEVMELRPEATNVEVDLSSVPTGAYLVSLRTKDAQKTVRIVRD